MPHSKVIGIIPARLASTRFPKKMLVDIFGKSLIQRTYENACRAKKLEEVVVATDDPFIFAHVTSFGGKVVLTSPDCPTGSDRVAEAAETHFPNAEIIVNIQGDEPCLEPMVIDSLAELLLDSKEKLIGTAVSPIRFLEQIKKTTVVKCVFDQNGRALYFSRVAIPFSTVNTAVCYRHIGIYAYRSEFLKKFVQLTPTPCQMSEDLEQLKILEHGFPIHVAIVEDQAIGVDTPDDLEVIKKILCQENTFSSQVASSLL